MELINHTYESQDLLESFIRDNELVDSSRILVQIFSWVIDPVIIRRVSTEVKALLPSATILGATTGGEFADGVASDGKILVSFSVYSKTNIRSMIVDEAAVWEADNACRFAADKIVSDIVAPNTKAVIILSDGFNSCIENVLRHLSDFAPHISVVGGKAWDNLAFTPDNTWIFLGDKVVNRGFVAYSLSGDDLRIFTDYNLNWLTLGKILTVTKAEWTHLYELDNIPVIEVYKKYLWERISENLPMSALEFPLVIHRGETLAARGAIKRFEDNSLLLTWNIQVGDKVQFGCGYKEWILRWIEDMQERIMAHPVEGIYSFSCAGRKTFLEADIAKEIESIGHIAPNIWFFTYSEFYWRSTCSFDMLNFSMVNLCISETETTGHALPQIEKSEIKDHLTYALSNIAVSTSNDYLELNDFLQKKVDEKVSEIERANLEHIEAYKRVVENMSHMAWMWDIKTGQTIYANPKFSEISWYGIEEVLQKRIDEFYDQDTRNLIESNRPKRLLWQVTVYTGNLISKSGEQIPVEIRWIPFIGGMSVAIIRDLREIRRLEKQNRELQELNAAKNEFLNVASHELRTPMTSIKGYLSMILEDDFWEIGSKLRETVELLWKNSDRLIRIINDMLDISKLESGKIEFREEVLSVDKLLSDIYMEHENNVMLREKNIEFVLEWSCRDCVVKTDSDRFRQVITNLLGNAFKFTPENGKVAIRYMSEDWLFRVSIIDSGIGIALENHEKVFQKFSQIGSTLRRKYEWTGLGLAITKELIGRMWGDIFLESELGKWSVFTVVMPLYVL